MPTPDSPHDSTPVDGHFVPIDGVEPGCDGDQDGDVPAAASAAAARGRDPHTRGQRHHDHDPHANGSDHAGHYHPDLSHSQGAEAGRVPVPRARVDVLDLLRFLSELFAFVSLCVWGFVAFPLPWNIVAGILAPVAAILVWALFRSPRAVFDTDTFGKAIAEIVVMSAAAFAWWGMGHPVVAVVWAVVALLLGILVGRRELARAHA
jgi:hypothetical protein